jgi:hypothetical protein
VKSSEAGEPLAVFAGIGWLEVRLLRRPWRVDQLWWRTRPIDRLYFLVATQDGPPLTLFHDLISGDWFEQQYQ